MDFGIKLPNLSAVGNRETLLAVARKGEALGCTIAWASDHIVFPEQIETPYPYSAAGRFPVNRRARFVLALVSNNP